MNCDEKKINSMEGNYWHDVYWGMDLKTREGENHLGEILMTLRQDFCENGLPDESERCPVQSSTPSRASR